MANITRFNPLRDIERFSPFRELEEMWRNMALTPQTAGITSFADIRLDVTEDENAYVVRADMPGVAKDDIKVSVDGNQVTIAAEVSRKDEEHGPGLLRCERFHGRMYRSFTLDSVIDEEKADAKYENGVLELTLPKKEGGAKGHQLAVH